VWRLDLGSGEQRHLGVVDGNRVAGNNLWLSPSGNRVVVGDVSMQVTDLDGFQVSIASTMDHPFFLEDDVYVHQTAMGELEPGIARVRTHGEVERVATNAQFPSGKDVRSLRLVGIPTAAGKRLLIERSDKQNLYQAYSLIDADTLEETPLTSLGDQAFLFSLAPSGRWLLFNHMPRDPSAPLTLDVLDAAGESTLLPIMAAKNLGEPKWRPDQDEVWINQEGDTIARWNPNVGARVVAGNPYPLRRKPSAVESSFTQDGRYWFSRAEKPVAPLWLRSAEMPEDPGILIAPENSWVDSYWDVPDGRLLFAVTTTSFTRANALLIDPASRITRDFSLHGQILAAGRTRFLALIEWEESRECGVLALVDLDSGKQTRLAENVTSVAVDAWTATGAATTDDPLAPGVRVAFISRNRMASSYDGAWIVALP